MWNWNDDSRWKTSRIPLSYNCTNVELKFYYCLPNPLTSLSLIIAPMWNWNLAFGRSLTLPINAYNCTNVELKSLFRRISAMRSALIIAPMWNWNEILCDRNLFFGIPLIIAPMWNWNRWITKNWKRSIIKLIIAPMWNWNVESVYSENIEIISYNCTNVELKYKYQRPQSSWHSLLIIAPMWNWNFSLHTLTFSDVKDL